MGFKGTRGPWEMRAEEVDKPYIRIRGMQLGCRYKVANVLTPVYDGVLDREAEETRANARLIAAAPDLLALVVEALSDGCIYPDWDERARALIAKATGETAWIAGEL